MKTKLLLFLSGLIIITSCKKNDVVKTNLQATHSFEELKKIILTDTNINNALLAQKTMEMLKQKKINNYISFPNKKVFSTHVIKLDSSYFKNIKTKKDVVVAISRTGIPNADIIGEQIYIQVNSIRNFVKNYPEVRKLTKDQATELLRIVFSKKYNDQQVVNNTSLYKVNSEDCLGGFNYSFQGCNDVLSNDLFNVAMTALTTGVETDGIEFFYGIYSTVQAYQANNDCVNSAADSYYLCVYGTAPNFDANQDDQNWGYWY